ncbi:MAG TPA: shikimate kinase [Chloroflexia bacterium]|jgi:shikimate kinase
MIDQALSSVILIGPYGTGKSTIAELIAPKLGVPHVSMDTEQHYYAEVGFDKEEFRRLYREVSQRAADLYFQSFFPAAMARLLHDHPGHVIDLGAGHTVSEDPARFARIKALLDPYPNVVLILPSPDLDRSISVLRERTRDRPGADFFFNSEFDYFNYWVKSPCNFELAKLTVYTEGKTPEQTASEVLRALNS